MNRGLFTLLLLIFSLAATWGQSSNWQEVPRLYGGSGHTLVKTNSEILYSSYNNGKEVYRSDDGGDNWQLVYETATGNSTFYIGSTGTFYVRNGTNWYKSINDGLNWNQMNVATNQTYKFVETPSGTLAGYSFGYFLVSQDGGTSWTQTSDFPQADDLDVDRLDITPYGGLLASTYTGNNDTIKTYYRSTDEGQSWQRIQAPYPSSSLFIAPTGTIFLSTTSDGLHRSTDMGLTFVPVPDAPNAGGNYMIALPSGRLLAIALSESFFSDDDGLTWQSMNVKFDSWSAAQITPLSDGSIFSDALYSLYKSSDGGQTWHFSANGIRQGEVRYMRFVSDSVFYAGSINGIWKTNDAGQNWSLLTANRTVQNYGFFELTSSGGLVAVQDDKLFWTATGDLPLVEVTPPDSLTFGINKVIVNPFNDHFFVSTKKRLARSTDYGQSWQTVLDSAFVQYAAFHPSGRILAIANNERIIISDDEGLTWDTAAKPPSIGLANIKISPEGDIYALAVVGNDEAQLLKSEDAGASWHFLEGDIGTIHFWNTALFDIAANGHLFRSDYPDNNLFLSANEGLSWQNFPEPDLAAGNYFTLSLFISPDQYLYVHTNEGSYRTLHPVSQGAFIRGSVRRDADADCSTPDAQSPLKNWIVEADGNFDYYTRTDPTGQYTFFVDTGHYEVSIKTPNLLWWDFCDSTQTAVLDELLATDTVDFATLALSDCPLMTTSIAAPFLRRCFDNTLFVQYCNQGSETADSAWVDVLLDPYLSFVSSAQPHNSLGNNTYRFFLDDVESGECGQFSLVTYVDCDATVLGQTHCIMAHAYPDTLCTTVPNWSGATIEAKVECQDTSVQLRLHNTGAVPSETLDYIIIEDDVVLMSGEKQYGPNETLTLDRSANGHTWRIESQQEPGHPFSNVAVAFAEGCGGFESLGFINQFNVNTFQPSWNRVCFENIGAYDPNDKRGFPLGFGSEHRIRPGQELDYMIRFQNTGTDTAFNIVIRDTLSAWLDPASVRPGAASHPYTWELSGQGVLSFTFANILLPDSNTNLAASQGFVTFKINQQPDVPLQTRIFNSAAIYFDFNPPVITNQTFHTIGMDYLVGTHAPKDLGKQNQIVVSPNPVSESAVFQLKEGVFDQHHLTLTNAQGQVVREKVLSGKQCVFQRNGLPPGVYFFRVADAAGRRAYTGAITLK